jgi:hypothetical protein
VTLRPAHVDPDSRRQDAEARIRAATELLVAALVDLAETAPEPARPVELLSVTQAAERLGGMSRSTLYQCLNRGTVRSVLVSGRRLIPGDEIARLARGDRAERDVAVSWRKGARRVTGAAVP